MKNKKLILGVILLIVALVMIVFGIKYMSDQNKDETASTNDESSLTSDSAETSESKEEKVDFSKLALPQLSNEVAENETELEIVTSMGSIKVKLFPELAPKAVENFVKHSKGGYYNGTPFHRVINEFMIQGGDPQGNGTGGESIWGKPFGVEKTPELYHIRGALAMAKTNDPISIGSQFYIVQNDQDQSSQVSADDMPEKIVEAYKKGGTPFLDGQYTVFGQVIEGMDIVDKIAALPVGANDKPNEEVTVQQINVIKEAN